MGITIHWQDDAQTRLLFTFEPTWTLEQFKQAILESARMIRSQPHPVHLIADLRAIQTVQMAVAVQGASFAARHIEQQLGAVVIVNTNPMLNTAITCARGFLSPLAGRIYTISNPDMAERIVKHVENRLLVRV